MSASTRPLFRVHRSSGASGSEAGALRERLGEALAEAGTILVLVFGTGPFAEAAEDRCRALALDPGFEAVRVLRVADRRVLTAEQRQRWRCGAGPCLAVLGADRQRAVPLARPDAVELFVAVSMVAAA